MSPTTMLFVKKPGAVGHAKEEATPVVGRELSVRALDAPGRPTPAWVGWK